MDKLSYSLHKGSDSDYDDIEGMIERQGCSKVNTKIFLLLYDYHSFFFIYIILNNCISQ